MWVNTDVTVHSGASLRILPLNGTLVSGHTVGQDYTKTLGGRTQASDWSILSPLKAPGTVCACVCVGAGLETMCWEAKVC